MASSRVMRYVYFVVLGVPLSISTVFANRSTGSEFSTNQSTGFPIDV
jgi:hypothetical protein